MIVSVHTRDSWMTGRHADATRCSSPVAAEPGCAWSGVPDTNHEAEIEGPQSWVCPMTDADGPFSVPMAKAATSTSSPPTSEALAQIIHRV